MLTPFVLVDSGTRNELINIGQDSKSAPAGDQDLKFSGARVLADRSEDLGYPTKESEPRCAKSQKVVLGCMPRTEEVMELFERLQTEFSGAELGKLLAKG